ncbi:MAG: helix-turn-helix transcriptional regulator [Rhodospirillaceae bacterium]|jgi:transcriptional regulator with XRE-family HTH domain|nr:helix-turn-helix transcriptional regulator [Rhodospirillaceae bacterium]
MSTLKTTTYSMIVAQLLDESRKSVNLNQADFFKQAGISQSSWSRINRGLSYFTLEEMRSACGVIGVKMQEVLKDADQASELLPKKEGVEILRNLKGSENKSMLPTIIAGAALGFLIFRLLKR